nr:ABC transporter permease [Xylophilus sp.]
MYNRLEPILLSLILFGLWWLGAGQGWISSQVLPPPQFVGETLRDLATSGDLWLHTQASLQRVLLGFAAGTLLGLLLGTAMGLSRNVEAYVLPTFNALVQIPVLGWLPFVLLLVGIGEPLKIILIAKAALVPVALNTLQGFRQAPPALREVGRVYGYTRRQEVLEIVLPTAVPTLFTGIRLGFTKAWLSLVVVELVASSEGLGYLIVYGRQLFQLDLVMAAVIVVGAIGYAIDRLLDRAERRLFGARGATTAGGR